MNSDLTLKKGSSIRLFYDIFHGLEKCKSWQIDIAIMEYIYNRLQVTFCHDFHKQPN